jgi:hypothetical protein
MGLADWSDDELLARLTQAVEAEARDLAAVLERLGELERRRLHEKGAFPGLFEFCITTLRYSEGAAARRIAAARLSLEAPEVLELVRERRVHLAGLYLIVPLVKKRPVRELLRMIEGKTKREVERLVASLGEERKAPVDVIRYIPPAAPIPQALDEPPATLFEPANAVPNDVVVAPTCAAATPPAAAPMARISFTATEAFLTKVEAAKALLSEGSAAASLERLFDRALDALFGEIDPLRPLGTAREASPYSRRPSRRVRYLVWKRDEARCAFLAPDGRRCEATTRLQFDHITPWAVGGRSDDPDNIRLLCRTHNLFVARLRFGDRRSRPALSPT